MLCPVLTLSDVSIRPRGVIVQPYDRAAARGYSRCDPDRDRPRPRCGPASAQVTGPGSTTRRNCPMPTGTVKFFNESKGFGFIQPEGGGADAFVHISDVERSGMSSLRENQRVSYDVEQDQRGKMKATNLRAAEGSGESAGDAQ